MEISLRPDFTLALLSEVLVLSFKLLTATEAFTDVQAVPPCTLIYEPSTYPFRFFPLSLKLAWYQSPAFAIIDTFWPLDNVTFVPPDFKSAYDVPGPFLTFKYPLTLTTPTASACTILVVLNLPAKTSINAEIIHIHTIFLYLFGI